MARRKEIDVTDNYDGTGKGFDEVGSLPPVEQVSENDFVSAAELEKFMNEKLTIIVHETDSPGALEVICPQVNGVNQPIVRGDKAIVKRKYVEVLARSMITTQHQRVRDLNDPSSIETRGKSVRSYPFTVLHDPNPNGEPWLMSIIESVKAEALR